MPAGGYDKMLLSVKETITEKGKMMKYKHIAILLAAALFLCACGGASESSAPDSSAASSESTESTSQAAESSGSVPQDGTEETDDVPIVDETVAEAGIDAFITLGDYVGIEIPRSEPEPVTDDQVNAEVANYLSYMPVSMPAETEIQYGMTANIDYAGTVDGVAFDGGTDQGFDLIIGSGSFVDDFEDQLIGHKAGETVVVTVTFPENYYEHLAGKDAEFTVTINEVKAPLEEATDEWVAANTSYGTVAEFREEIRSSLEKDAATSSMAEMRSAAWNAVLALAEYKQYPKDRIEAFTAFVRENLAKTAAQYGMNTEEFMTYANLTEADIEADARMYVGTELISDAILARENVAADGPEAEEMLKTLLEGTGYTTREAAVAAGVSETQIDFAVKNSLAVDRVIAHATLTD